MHCRLASVISLVMLAGAALFTDNVIASDTANTEAQNTSAAFDVLELRVLGNTVLPAQDIERVLLPFLGSNKTLQDMEAARKTLEDFYHERGYGTVYLDIPDQTIDEGIVRLKVTEAALGRVQVSGARYFSQRQIRAALPEAKEGKVPLLAELTNEVAQVNTQTRDRTVVPVLKPGSRPGTVDLSLKVDDYLPVHASLEVNDYYTADTKPLRVNAGVSYDHLFARFDSVAINYQLSPQDTNQVKVWMGSYTAHVFDDSRLTFLYVDSKSAVATLGSGDAVVNVLGTGKDASVRLAVPLAGKGNSLGSITLAADYKDYVQNICTEQVTALCSNTGLITPIHYINFSAGYSGGWLQELWQSTFSLTGNFGVRGLRNDPAEFENKRFLGTANYFDFRSDGMLLFKLPAQLNLQLRYGAQYAFDPLVTNEQFAIAGSDGVRGYLESEELGDRGVKTTVQLGSPQWKLLKSKLLIDAFVFYDYGTARLIDALPSDIASISLQSIGAGLNVSTFAHFYSTLFWSHALDDGTQTKRGDSRVQFDVRATW